MEYWVNDRNYLRISSWDGPDVPMEQWSEHDKSLFPRTDTTVRYDGNMYRDVRKDPEVLTSEVLGMGVFTLDGYRDNWDASDISNDFNMLFFERGNHTISDEMVRFRQTWPVVGLEFDEAGAILTYKFDENGDLCYMEYETDYDDHTTIFYIEIFDDTAAEIDAKIRPYTENLIVGEFSWADAKAKYTDEEFNIRETGFINTEIAPVSGPVEAARLALKEYPNLGEYLSVDVTHDDAAGM